MKRTLPARLDQVVDDVGVGAILKNVITDQICAVVDCDNSIMVGYYKINDGAKEPSFGVTNFGNNEDWVVLTLGYDYDLSE